ncbi:DNA-binding protein [Chitinophaga agrisoli]|uniref:DNA-binding protein n=1 Tax=Chitinophaga agrisoli TaxID=2607653 RepID=A0A5B2VSV9_9BACT|nr:glycosyl hydrolase [Chitinophaga agrisoli]KAA2241740.1 DNA-binding protein [Chitinophaga agrisoli]
MIDLNVTKHLRKLLFAGLCLLLLTGSLSAQTPRLEQAFRRPPPAAKPWVFWYWMQASVSRAGITADLEAMKAAGIGGAYLMPIKGPANPPLMQPPVVQLTPEWWAMVRHAMQEADRLGLHLAMHDCDGFALAGGPWITPALSMQKIVWSETQVTGNRLFDETLPQPQAYKNYYEDIAVLAYPALPGAGVTPVPTISTSLPGRDARFLADPNNRENFRSDTACWIQYAFEQPFTCRNIHIRSNGPNYQAQRLIVTASDDGHTFRTVGRLEPPRHGWQDNDTGVTHVITPTTARFFRFAYDTTGSEAGAEDLDAAKWKATLKVCGITLSAEPRLNQYEGKIGEIWRVSRPTTTTQLPDSLCVPLDKIIDLTASADKQGRLHWQVPPGRWTILRIGHTSTGHTNATGGGGIGLECDKFNPAAIRLQFDQWFGEIYRQVGPSLAERVLKVFHIDSWECGSQNWSPVFREEFRRRRGYDLFTYLPAMAGIPVQSAAISERFLHDIRQTIAELVVDNFYGTMGKLAREKGCSFSAENVAPTMTSDGMAHFRAVDIPMGEFWLRSPTHDKPNDMADAISGAHIYGKPIIQAEAFTELRLAWDEYPGMLKALQDKNYAAGINRLVYHVFAHNPWMDRQPGMTLDGIGLYFQRDQTWWKPGRAWVSYAQRCQALLQQGRPVIDLAVFTGEEIPRRAVLPERILAKYPGLQFINYDSFNPDALSLAKVHNGRIELPGGASYQALLIPGAHALSPDGGMMSSEVATRLRELAAAGANILMADQPDHTPGLSHFPASEDTLHNIIKTLRPGNWNNWKLQPDFAAWDTLHQQRDTGILYTHRRTPEADIYFVSSQWDSTRILTCSFRVNGKVPELWNPVTGDIKDAKDWERKDGVTQLPLKFDPSGSWFIIFRKPAKAQAQHTGKNWSTPQTLQTLSGSWQAAFNPKVGGPAKHITFTQLEDWSKNTDAAIRYYSGTVVYTQTFDWQPAAGGRIWLDLGKVANIAEVSLNGMPCGVAWTAPYRVDISTAIRRGKNTLRIEVTNTWANRLTGDHTLPAAQQITHTTAPYRLLEGKPLLEAGLLGPVNILKTTE